MSDSIRASLPRFETYGALIFDLDGTLMDSGPLQEAAWRATLAQFELPVDEVLMRSLAGVSTLDTARAVWEHFGVTAPVDFGAVAAFKEEYLRSHIFTHVQPTRLALVAEYYRGRIPMSVGTGAHTLEARDILEHCQILKWFDHVVGADQVAHPKPAPDTFLRCAELMGVAADACMVFEDAALGLEAAARAGMDSVDVGAEYGIIYDYFGAG